MAFIKVRDIKSKEAAIINPYLYCCFVIVKKRYIVFFSSGNVGSAYYEYDEENAKKIFDAIGVSL